MAESPVAIVTGAGSGIGRATCTLLAAAGFRVTLAGRTRSKLVETAKLMSPEHSQSLVAAADVAEPSQARSIIDQTLQKWGRIDALINNAAIVAVRPIEQTDRELLADVFAINAFGPAYLIAHAWPVFLAQHGGCIVNVSSIATVDPFPGLAVYAASKAALESLTRSVMVEGGSHGIRAFAIAPGAVETDMLRQVVSKEDLPTERAHDVVDVARIIMECVSGQRDEEMGKTIYLANR